MKCVILAIGEELVKGEYYETNGKLIAEELTSYGIEVVRIEIIPDDIDRLIRSIVNAINDSELIITTGGLGPTDDDLTRYAFSSALELPLMINEEELMRIKNLFKRFGFKYSKDNDRQAFFPKTSEIILNKKGTASGFYINYRHTQIFTLPGVPEQAEYLFKNYVLKKLDMKKIIDTYSFTAKTQNLAEAYLNELFREKIETENMKWGTRFREDGIHLNVSIKGKNAKKILEKTKNKVIQVYEDNIWGWDEESLPELIGGLLKENSLNLCTIESCTGGLIGKLLTDIPGSSKYYVGGAIVYSNEMKMNFLKVNPTTIKDFGAVSEQCVTELADNGRKIFGTDFAIAISGIAGPDGGSDEKPVGTVWIGIAGPEKTKAFRFVLPGKRETVRLRTAYYALGILNRMLEKT